MTKALFVALCLLSFNALAETKLNFSGDAYVRGYFLNGTGPDHTQAFNHFFRLNVNAQPDESLTLKTGLVLAAETWEGDTHKTNATGGTNEDGLGNGNTTHLDHAVIEYKKDSLIVSAGRHAVTTPGCFLTCDDRRDRIQVLKFMSNYDLLAFAYDKRAEGSLSNSRNDLDMVTVAYYGALPLFKYALQGGYWISKKYDTTTFANSAVNLDNIKQFTPQLTGQFLGVDYNLYYSILWGGSALYKNDHHSAALRLTKDLEVVKIDYQSIFTKRGGLVVGGFDTLSNVINNSPDHNQSSIKLRTIGYGLGVTKKDETLHLIKLSKNINAELTASVGGGLARILSTAGGNTIEKNTVLDASVKYTFSNYLNLMALYGKFFGDNKDHAGSLSLNAKF